MKKRSRANTYVALAKKIKTLTKNTGERIGANKKAIQPFVLAFVHAFLIYYCLEIGNKNFLMNGVLFTPVNIITVFAITAFVYVFVQRWWLSAGIMSVPLTVLSVINYYTLVFRNSPVSTQDLYNAGTAMSVLDSYSFPLTGYVIAILALFALSVALVCRIYRLEKGKKNSFKSVLVKDACIICAFVCFFYVVYFAENPIKPNRTFVWSWEDSYYKYGYAASTIEVFQTSLETVVRPEGYSEETLERRVGAKQPQEGGTRKPDVIFILNETFYDMRDLVDLGDTPSAMPFIDSLPETQKGRAVVAGTGGGTNKSEYEFLTSNTIQMMPGITPFNYLRFEGANSILSHLEALGYTSWAAHCAEGLNYSRNIAYKDMGFDNILFDVDFGEKELFGYRPYATDEFCYNRMIADYENMGDDPRFMYLLTIQNHGNWDINDASFELISSKTDFGQYTDDVNEFLSCVSLSDKAFRELTEYFEKSERDVIICMVGDHCPSFAVELAGEIDRDKTFALRSTPYVIWSNFDMDIDAPAQTSMVHLAPMVLEAADCPQSAFYGYLNQLRKTVPVLTAFNLYKTADEGVYDYDDNTPYKKDIDVYFDLVYNNVSEDANRIQKIFDAKR